MSGQWKKQTSSGNTPLTEKNLEKHILAMGSVEHYPNQKCKQLFKKFKKEKASSVVTEKVVQDGPPEKHILKNVYTEFKPMFAPAPRVTTKQDKPKPLAKKDEAKTGKDDAKPWHAWQQQYEKDQAVNKTTGDTAIPKSSKKKKNQKTHQEFPELKANAKKAKQENQGDAEYQRGLLYDTNAVLTKSMLNNFPIYQQKKALELRLRKKIATVNYGLVSGSLIKTLLEDNNYVDKCLKALYNEHSFMKMIKNLVHQKAAQNVRNN